MKIVEFGSSNKILISKRSNSGQIIKNTRKLPTHPLTDLGDPNPNPDPLTRGDSVDWTDNGSEGMAPLLNGKIFWVE